MTDRFILDASGEPVPCDDLIAWARWMETNGSLVMQDQVGDDVCVSTVFLGLDHQFGDGPPVLWETMVFGGPLNREMQRYTSRADALRGHTDMTARALAAAAGTVTP